MTDPVTVAREVLEADRARQEFSASNPFGAWDILAQLQQTFSDNAPHLAHAVIDLTAKVERVEALADRLEREADELNGHPSRLAAHTGSVKKRTVARIRTALNGENR